MYGCLGLHFFWSVCVVLRIFTRLRGLQSFWSPGVKLPQSPMSNVQCPVSGVLYPFCPAACLAGSYVLLTTRDVFMKLPCGRLSACPPVRLSAFLSLCLTVYSANHSARLYLHRVFVPLWP